MGMFFNTGPSMEDRLRGQMGGGPIGESAPIVTPGPPMGTEPKKNGKFGGILGGILGGALDGVATYYGAEPGYATQRKEARDQQKLISELLLKAQIEAQQREQARLDGRGEKQWEWQNKPKDPHWVEDNGGNNWEIGPDGQPKLVFADKIPKMYIQGDQALQIPNPFAGQGGGGLPHASSPADIAHLPPGSQFIAPDGSVRTVPGGGGSNAPGGFPGY